MISTSRLTVRVTASPARAAAASPLADTIRSTVAVCPDSATRISSPTATDPLTTVPE